MECYAEAVCGGLNKSNPQSKAQTAQFLSRLLSRHDSSTVPIEAVKNIVPDLLKVMSLGWQCSKIFLENSMSLFSVLLMQMVRSVSQRSVQWQQYYDASESRLQSGYSGRSLRIKSK